jgi:transposase-like protein
LSAFGPRAGRNVGNCWPFPASSEQQGSRPFDFFWSNGLERINKEVRRTRVASLFPSQASCLRLVSAVLMEISDAWETGRAYLTFEKENA